MKNILLQPFDIHLTKLMSLITFKSMNFSFVYIEVLRQYRQREFDLRNAHIVVDLLSFHFEETALLGAK